MKHPIDLAGVSLDVISLEDEAIVVAFRRHMLLPLDDCLYAYRRRSRT
jgi:hypothetical protein